MAEQLTDPGTFVVVAPFLALLVAAWWRRSDHGRRARLRQRPDIPISEIWEEGFHAAGVSKDLVETVFQVVALAVAVPASKLRPTDRFGEELRPDAGWEFDDGMAEVRWFAEAELRKHRANTDLSEVSTIGDLILRLHRCSAGGAR